MTKQEREQFERLWKRMVSGGIPLSEGFEIAVVKAHAAKAFRAGLRAGKKR